MVYDRCHDVLEDLFVKDALFDTIISATLRTVLFPTPSDFMFFNNNLIM